jgi:hypothetical protein
MEEEEVERKIYNIVTFPICISFIMILLPHWANLNKHINLSSEDEKTNEGLN